jgi:hypothetical protein
VTCQINTKGESASGDSTAASKFPEILHKATEQLYNHNETALYYKLLPNKLLDFRKALSNAGGNCSCVPVRLATTL